MPNGPAQASAPAGRRAAAVSPARDLYEQGRQTGEQLVDLGVAIRSLLGSSHAFLHDRMRRRPYGTIAAAAGVGYVLGGGLSPAAVRLLISAGGRVAFEMFLHRFATDSHSSPA
jgi:hypothetical protein